MKRKKWFICEGIFTLATCIVVAYAARHRQDAFIIFTSYMLVIAVLSVALTVYWQTSSARAIEANCRRIAYFIDNINTPPCFGTTGWSISGSTTVCGRCWATRKGNS